MSNQCGKNYSFRTNHEILFDLFVFYYNRSIVYKNISCLVISITFFCLGIMPRLSQDRCTDKKYLMIFFASARFVRRFDQRDVQQNTCLDIGRYIHQCRLLYNKNCFYTYLFMTRDFIGLCE